MVKKEYWEKLSLAEQLGNIGSEFHRWQKTKSDKSFAEVLYLLDLTISDRRSKPRLRELLRLREVICDIVSGAGFYGTKLETIEKYFLDFAILARN